jgi:hypothetical protein
VIAVVPTPERKEERLVLNDRKNSVSHEGPSIAVRASSAAAP